MTARSYLIVLGIIGLAVVLLGGPYYAAADPGWSGALPMPRPQAQPTPTPPTPFMFPPYFGTTRVNSIFDHEYPLLRSESEVTSTNVYTITHSVIHYDGIRRSAI